MLLAMMQHPIPMGMGVGMVPQHQQFFYRYQHNNLHNAGTKNVKENGNEEQVHFVRPMRGFNYGDS